jgi:hypothetical protein
MKVSSKTAQRAHIKAVSSRVVLCESVFRCGDKTITVLDNLSTLIDRDPAREQLGRFMGYRNKINEPVLREICGLGVDRLSTLTRERWGGQVGANLGGQSVHTEGKERKGLNASTGESNPEPLAPRGDFVSLIIRITYLFRAIQVRRGESPLDPVRGFKANRILKKALASMQTILPPMGVWLTWERMANLFSFWVEHHPTKKLHFASSVFASPDEYEIYLPELYEWEAANPNVQFRDLLPNSTPADDVDDDRENDPRLQDLSATVFDITGVSGYFPSVKDFEKLLAFADIQEIEHALWSIGKTGALGTRKTKVRDFFEHNGAVSVISSIRADEKRQEAEAAAKKKAADDKAFGENWMREAEAHLKDDDLGIAWIANQAAMELPKIEWAIPDDFIPEWHRLRKAVEDRRKLSPIAEVKS